MKKLAIFVAGCMLVTSCNLFGPVDPIGPTVSTGVVTDVQQSSFRITGTISNPDYKNKRQEKKSGQVTEYGFVYGTSEDPAAGVVRKVGDTIKTFPFDFGATISGLTPNASYKVWAYAKNETGILTYGNESGKQSIDYPNPNPTISVSQQGGFRAPALINFSTADNTPGAVYAWDFGDGGKSAVKNPSYTYTTGGSKIIKLTITANGNVKSNSHTITIDAPYTGVILVKITLKGYAQSRADGTGWDNSSGSDALLSGGPDIYIVGQQDYGNGVVINALISDVHQNVTPGQVSAGSISWTVNQRFTSSITTTNAMNLTDHDRDKWEQMGTVNLRFPDYMTVQNKYPVNISLQGAGSTLNSALKMDLVLKWE